VVNLLEALYAMTVLAAVMTGRAWYRASRGDAPGRASRRAVAWRWTAATTVAALMAVILYWYLTPGT